MLCFSLISVCMFNNLKGHILHAGLSRVTELFLGTSIKFVILELSDSIVVHLRALVRKHKFHPAQRR